MALTNVSIPVSASAVVESNSFVATIPWFNFFSLLSTQLNAAIAVINTVPGLNVFTLATQPTLGPTDAGYLGFVSDYSHWARWTGAVWMRLDDAPGLFHDCIADPGVGYALCNGVGTTLLVFGGATLTTSAFVPPDMVSTPTYKKSIAAYTGTITPKAGTTGTGTTGTGTTGTGTSGAAGAHNHTGATGNHTHPIGAPSTRSDVSIGGATQVVTAIFADTNNATAPISTEADHQHSVPGLSVPGLSVPALAVGSIEMTQLGLLPYVRR